MICLRGQKYIRYPSPSYTSKTPHIWDALFLGAPCLLRDQAWLRPHNYVKCGLLLITQLFAVDSMTWQSRRQRNCTLWNRYLLAAWLWCISDGIVWADWHYSRWSGICLYEVGLRSILVSLPRTGGILLCTLVLICRIICCWLCFSNFCACLLVFHCLLVHFGASHASFESFPSPSSNIITDNAPNSAAAARRPSQANASVWFGRKGERLTVNS